MLAYDYPVLGVFWSMLVFFLWIMWFFLLFRIIGDLFRSDDLSGWGKAGWMIFLLVVPFLGVLVYVIARGDTMGKHEIARAQAQSKAFQSYVQEAASSGGAADQLTKLADLRDRGVITDAEFDQQKAKVLG